MQKQQAAVRAAWADVNRAIPSARLVKFSPRIQRGFNQADGDNNVFSPPLRMEILVIIAFWSNTRIHVDKTMMAYKTSEGWGYNPLYSITGNFSDKAWLLRYSDRNRYMALLNSLVATALLILAMLVLSNALQLTPAITALVSIILGFWTLAVIVSRGKESFHTTHPVSVSSYEFSIFTLEWLVSFLSVTVFLTAVRTLMPPTSLDTVLFVLSLFTTALMLIPLFEASRFMLTRRN